MLHAWCGVWWVPRQNASSAINQPELQFFLHAAMCLYICAGCMNGVVE